MWGRERHPCLESRRWPTPVDPGEQGERSGEHALSTSGPALCRACTRSISFRFLSQVNAAARSVPPRSWHLPNDMIPEVSREEASCPCSR